MNTAWFVHFQTTFLPKYEFCCLSKKQEQSAVNCRIFINPNRQTIAYNVGLASEDHDWPADSAFMPYRRKGFVRNGSSENRRIKFCQSKHLKSGVKEKALEPSFPRRRKSRFLVFGRIRNAIIPNLRIHTCARITARAVSILIDPVFRRPFSFKPTVNQTIPAAPALWSRGRRFRRRQK